MSNALTGDCDAVAQVALAAVNRVLAGMHQNGSTKDVSPSLLHSLTVRVGGMKVNARTGKDVSAARGTAELQLSTLTVTLPATPRTVTFTCRIMARYTPDPGTQQLPRYIHGDVQATLEASRVTLAGGGAVLQIKPLGDDQILFTPVEGISVSQVHRQRITEQVRFFVQHRFQPTNLPLPANFGALEFKGLSAPDGSQALALPIDLTGSQAGASGLVSVSTVFLKPGDDFAVAISDEYLQAALQPLKDSLKAFSTTVSFTTSVEVDVGGILTLGIYSKKVEVISNTFTYTVAVSDVSITRQGGAMTVLVTGKATTQDNILSFEVFPNYDFTVTQVVNLQFDLTGQTIDLVASGDPLIAGLPDQALSAAKSQVTQARDVALATAQKSIQVALAQGDQLSGILQQVDPGATLRYASVEFLAEGIVLRGRLKLAERMPAQVNFTEAETATGTEYSALPSWIPGGTIAPYRWTWTVPVAYTLEDLVITGDNEGGIDIAPVGEKNGERTFSHRFILSVPAVTPGRRPSSAGGNPLIDQLIWPEPGSQICLWADGSQLPSAWKAGLAEPYPVGEGTVCQVKGHHIQVPLLNVPLYVPAWAVNPGPEAREDDWSIVAHFDARAQSKRGVEGSTNAIIHFTGPDLGEPLTAIDQALRRGEMMDAALAVVLVLPRGTLDRDGAAVMSRLGTFAPAPYRTVTLTEDYEGDLARAFGVGEQAGTFLLDATGRLAWKRSGSLEVAAASRAFSRHLIRGGEPTFPLLRLAVGAGEPAPDFLFEYAPGQQMPLRRLRGQRVVLVFWKSWSAPCLEELRRLEEVQEQARRQGVVILAVNDGETPARLAEIRAEHHLNLTLVADPERTIARRYRVHCWPSMVSIDERGLVERVHSGLTPRTAPRQVRAVGAVDDQRVRPARAD